MPALQVRVEEGDVPKAFVRSVESVGSVAVDIETSGLDFRASRIGSIQLFDCVSRAVVLRPPYGDMAGLRQLMENRRVKKILHHAMFDLRFLRFSLGIGAESVHCTKIAAKIVAPNSSHSLRDLVRDFLQIDLSKDEQLSDWLKTNLSPAQLDYAVRDVVYLPRLLKMLLDQARKRRATALVRRSFSYIPTRVDLDIQGVGDVFVY